MSAVAQSSKRKVVLERLYVWQLPVRLTHWVIFFSIIILAATGYYIGNPFIAVPGEAKDHFVMGTVRAIHLYAAIAFTLAVRCESIGSSLATAMHAGPNSFPSTRERLRSFWKTFQYYSFIRHDPVAYAGHNALAGASYAFIFIIYLVMIATGLALYTVYAPDRSPFQVFGVPDSAVRWPASRAPHSSHRHVDHIDIHGGSCLFRVSVLHHRAHWNLRFDLFRLQVRPRKGGGQT